MKRDPTSNAKRVLEALQDLKVSLARSVPEAYSGDGVGVRAAPQRAAGTDQQQGVDVAVVCALHDPEYTAMLRAFGGQDAWTDRSVSGAVHRYAETSLARKDAEPLRVVAGVPSYMGLTATAILATQMLFLFRPRLIMMVGIAAGTQQEKQNVGDILVADPSVDFASGKLTEDAGSEAFQPDSRPINLPTHIQTFIKELARRRTSLDSIMDNWPAKKPNTRLAVRVGPVGASDAVVDSTATVEKLKKHWRKAVGLEMETYALYRAAIEAPGEKPLFLSLKSVCDFASAKDDDWQEYAAHTSAEYGAYLLRNHWEDLLGT